MPDTKRKDLRLSLTVMWEVDEQKESDKENEIPAEYNESSGAYELTIGGFEKDVYSGSFASGMAGVMMAIITAMESDVRDRCLAINKVPAVITPNNKIIIPGQA